MNIKSNTSVGIVGYDIDNVSLDEMRQMHELKNTIKNVLDSHKPDSKEKKYVSDDNLKLMHAILSVFTKKYEPIPPSAFDEFLREQEKPVEQSQQQEKNKPEPMPEPQATTHGVF